MAIGNTHKIHHTGNYLHTFNLINEGSLMCWRFPLNAVIRGYYYSITLSPLLYLPGMARQKWSRLVRRVCWHVWGRRRRSGGQRLPGPVQGIVDALLHVRTFAHWKSLHSLHLRYRRVGHFQIVRFRGARRFAPTAASHGTVQKFIETETELEVYERSLSMHLCRTFSSLLTLRIS